MQLPCLHPPLTSPPSLHLTSPYPLSLHPPSLPPPSPVCFGYTPGVVSYDVGDTPSYPAGHCIGCTVGAISNTSFFDNAVTFDGATGGAIADITSDGLTIDGCTFSNNSVSAVGQQLRVRVAGEWVQTVLIIFSSHSFHPTLFCILPLFLPLT